MKEQWIVEAEDTARGMAEFLLDQIFECADDMDVDKDWFFEKVIQFMGEDKNRRSC